MLSTGSHVEYLQTIYNSFGQSLKILCGFYLEELGQRHCVSEGYPHLILLFFLTLLLGFQEMNRVSHMFSPSSESLAFFKLNANRSSCNRTKSSKIMMQNITIFKPLLLWGISQKKV